MKKTILERIKSNEIMRKLNTLTLVEFMENYNKTEVERIIDDNERVNKLVEELQKELDGMFKEYKDDFRIFVTSSFIRLEERYYDDIINCETYHVVENIFSSIFHLIPFAYVMGKKLSKKQFESAMEYIKSKCSSN